jgi:hypothetical protein
MKKIRDEIKAFTSPKSSTSFWNSIETISPDRTMVVAPVQEPYPIEGDEKVVPLPDIFSILSA